MSVRAGTLPTVGALVLTPLPRYEDVNGGLVVVEGVRHVPFPIARMFHVQAAEGGVRGQHAHRLCAQFLTCPRGFVEVVCDDGERTARFALDRPDVGLFVPPGIWSEQIYRAQGSVLIVLCDRPYEAADYLREYGAFKAFRDGTTQPT